MVCRALKHGGGVGLAWATLGAHSGLILIHGPNRGGKWGTPMDGMPRSVCFPLPAAMRTYGLDWGAQSGRKVCPWK